MNQTATVMQLRWRRYTERSANLHNYRTKPVTWSSNGRKEAEKAILTTVLKLYKISLVPMQREKWSNSNLTTSKYNRTQVAGTYLAHSKAVTLPSRQVWLLTSMGWIMRLASRSARSLEYKERLALGQLRAEVHSGLGSRVERISRKRLCVSNYEQKEWTSR